MMGYSISTQQKKKILIKRKTILILYSVQYISGQSITAKSESAQMRPPVIRIQRVLAKVKFG